MTETHWTDRLSEYLDGELPVAERHELEAHLSGCAPCRETLAELRAVLEAAGILQDAPPEKDLWGGIAKAIDARSREDDQVIDLPARLGHPGNEEVDPRLRISVPQLVAAGLALMMASGALAWSLRPLAEESASVAAVAEPVGLIQASLPSDAPGTYSEELSRLQALMTEHRDELTPNTVRILEKNLAIIDRAIQESRSALEGDPGNEYLVEHLDRAFKRKVDYLRNASAIVGWTI